MIFLYFLFFANSPITKLHYNGADILNNKIDDSSISTFEFKNGVKGHIFVNWYNPFKEHKFVIVCSKGMVTYEDSSDKKQVILHKKNIVISNWLIMELKLLIMIHRIH